MQLYLRRTRCDEGPRGDSLRSTILGRNRRETRLHAPSTVHQRSSVALLMPFLQASLDCSLPIKRIEAGLKSLVLWGRITTQNGKVRVKLMQRCLGAKIGEWRCWRINAPAGVSTPLTQYGGVVALPLRHKPVPLLSMVCTPSHPHAPWPLLICAHAGMHQGPFRPTPCWPTTPRLSRPHSSCTPLPQDYLIAEGSNDPLLSVSGHVHSLILPPPPHAQDYLIAEGSNDPLLSVSGDVHPESKLYYSLDGVKWVDLQAIDDETAKHAATVQAILVGDPAKAYEVSEKDPVQPPPPAEGEEAEGPRMLLFQVGTGMNTPCWYAGVYACTLRLSQSSAAAAPEGTRV